MTQPANIPPTAPAPVAPTPPNATGALPDVDSETLTNAFRTGALALESGKRVGVRGPDGAVGSVPAEEAGKAIDAGAELVSDKTLQQAVLEAKYGGVGGTAGAFAAGAGRGLTFGLSDAALAGLGGTEMRERLNAYQELHPIASTAGEIAGVVAPSLLSGGAAAGVEGAGMVARGARVLGAANEGVGALGRLAGAGIERVVGRGAEGLAARALQRGAVIGAEGATMGSVAGLGAGISHEALSEEALGPPSAVAERLFAATAHGALLGGALGGALGAGAEVGSAALKSAAVRAHPHIEKAAEESGWKALNARKAFQEQAAEIPGGHRAIARTLLDDGVIAAGDTVETLAPKVAKARAAAGEAIETTVAKVAENETVALKDVFERLEKRASEFDKKLGFESAAAAVRKQKENLAAVFMPARGEPLGAIRTAEEAAAARTAAENTRIPLTDLLRARRELESTVNWQTEAVAGQGMKAAGRTLEDVVVESGDELARKRGLKDWSTEYKAAKLQYRRMALADDAITDSLDRMHANAGHSLTDKIFAAHGATGALMGVAAGHPAALGGLLAGQVSKQIRTRGSSVTAVMLDKLASLGRVQETMAGVDSNINRAARAYFDGKQPRGGLRGTKLGAHEVDVAQWQKAVSAYKADPQGTIARTTGAVEGVAAHAPNVAREYGAVAKRAMAFLASKLPEPSQPAVAPQFAHLAALRPMNEGEMRRLNPQEAETFKRYVRAATNPESMLEDFARGRLSLEAVEAVRAVAPELYADMRAKVEAGLVAHPDRLSYQQKLGLSVLFDVAPEWSMTPEGIRTLQGAVAANNAEEAAKKKSQQQGAGGMNGNGSGGPGAAAGDAARSSMPASERLETRRMQ